MKTKTLVLALPVLLVLGGCLGTSNNQAGEDALLTGSDVNTPMVQEKTLEECKASVDAYLKQAEGMKIDNSQTIESGNTVVVDYIGRLEDGEVFDTSVESVAKECNLYTNQRDYSEGLEFEVGAGMMIAGFDQGVLGMSTNETKTIDIEAKDAYGEETTMTIAKTELAPKPDGSDYQVGDMLMTQAGPTAITSIDEDTIQISNPHPLAGKDLIFDITIKEIK